MVRNGEGGRELVLARWGMPSSPRRSWTRPRNAPRDLRPRARESTSRRFCGSSRTAARRISETWAARIGSAGWVRPIAGDDRVYCGADTKTSFCEQLLGVWYRHILLVNGFRGRLLHIFANREVYILVQERSAAKCE
jgi:hypothetical protein